MPYPRRDVVVLGKDQSCNGAAQFRLIILSSGLLAFGSTASGGEDGSISYRRDGNGWCYFLDASNDWPRHRILPSMWYHIGLVRRQRNLRLFMDGELAGEYNTPPGVPIGLRPDVEKALPGVRVGSRYPPPQDDQSKPDCQVPGAIERAAFFHGVPLSEDDMRGLFAQRGAHYGKITSSSCSSS